MQQTNLLKKSPINISLFTHTLTDDIFKDMRFVQLMNLLIKSENLYRYHYCIFCDSSLIKTNIFIPIFHTIYMSCKTNNILLNNQTDSWITEIFPNNKYYMLINEENNTFAHSSINMIDNIKDIPGVL